MCMKISVVMTTYNGEKYIVDQMKSILCQSETADEVLVFDDVSSDKTVFLIKDFIKKNDLSHWKLYINKENLGWKRNFMQGISKATGDMIFLSDQDDLWHERKIEMMKDVFLKEPLANLVVCNYQCIKANDSVKILNNDPKFSYSVLDQRLRKWNIPFPGCTYAFKKDFFYRIKGLWVEDLAHDFFIYQAAWLSNSIFVCSSVLHLFRRHDESATTKSAVLFDKKRRVENIGKKIKLLDSLMNFSNDFNCREGNILIHWLLLRKRFIENANFLGALKLLCCFYLYNSPKTFFTDCIVSLRSK